MSIGAGQIRLGSENTEGSSPRSEAIESEITFVLFIDMVGYSKLTMEDQLDADRRFREGLRLLPTYCAAVETDHVVTLDTGDGVALCFFGDPTWPPKACLELLPLLPKLPPMRIGLHCGPVVRLIDFSGKPNVRGVGINVAQRVVDCARPGSIFLTAHYADILASYSDWHDRIVSRGVHRVKHNLRLNLCELVSERGRPYRSLVERNRSDLPPTASYVGLSMLALAAALLGASFAGLWIIPATHEQSPDEPNGQINSFHSNSIYPTSNPRNVRAYP